MSEVDTTQYWNFIVIPSIVFLILYLIYAIITSRDTQTMSSRSLNSTIASVLKAKISPM
jgi:hypothetical protein